MKEHHSYTHPAVILYMDARSGVLSLIYNWYRAHLEPKSCIWNLVEAPRIEITNPNNPIFVNKVANPSDSTRVCFNCVDPFLLYWII